MQNQSETTRFDYIVFAYCVGVFLCYITPLRVFPQGIWKAFLVVSKVTPVVGEAAKATLDYWVPNLKESPKGGEVINGWVVTSEYGDRPAPCQGCSSFHRGVDLVAKIGQTKGAQLYAFGKPGDKVSLKCWWDDKGGGNVAEFTTHSLPGYKFKYLHLSKCAGNGEHKVGSVIGLVGDSGIGTGAHLHLGVEHKDEYIAPPKGFVWAALTGKLPSPMLSKNVRESP